MLLKDCERFSEQNKSFHYQQRKSFYSVLYYSTFCFSYRCRTCKHRFFEWTAGSASLCWPLKGSLKPCMHQSALFQAQHQFQNQRLRWSWQEKVTGKSDLSKKSFALSCYFAHIETFLAREGKAGSTRLFSVQHKAFNFLVFQKPLFDTRYQRVEESIIFF